MFIWAVRLTGIEMDLMFVLVVKFISVTRFITYYMYRPPPDIALWVQIAWEGGEFLNDECVGYWENRTLGGREGCSSRVICLVDLTRTRASHSQWLYFRTLPYRN